MSDGKPWTDKERLEQLYCDERMSVADMGEVFGCHGSTVHKYIQRYGIERDEPWKEKGWLQEHWVEKGKTTYEMAEDLPVGPLAIQQQLNNYGIEKPWKDKATLKQMYVEDQMSSSEIAQQLKCSPTTVLDWLHKHNIPVRDLDEAAKIANIQIPLWFGMTANGYERVDTQYDNEKDSVLHHRLLAVAKYGFDALEGKIVHHKNGVKWDNRFENIELVTRADHARIHKPRSKS